jgi:hypothetical protein
VKRGDTPKRRGRPAIPEGERKSHNLTFRARGDLRQLIEDAASDSGRSASEEIEFRLVRSFDREATVLEALGSKEHTELIRALYFVLGGRTDPASDQMLDTMYLSAITIILGYRNKPLDELVKSAWANIWFVWSMLGIRNAAEVDFDEAEKRAFAHFPVLAEAELVDRERRLVRQKEFDARHSRKTRKRASQ